MLFTSRPIYKYVLQVWKKKNENSSFKKGNFLTVCGHFCDNNIAIFHIIEIQTVILKCFVYLNLNWIKSYEIISG